MNPTNIDILINANREIIKQKEEEALKFIEEILKRKNPDRNDNRAELRTTTAKKLWCFAPSPKLPYGQLLFSLEMSGDMGFLKILIFDTSLKLVDKFCPTPKICP